MTVRWQPLALSLAPALLCIIAVTQMAFAHFATLSAWKGGGFGMFSTVDSPAARFLRIHLVTDRGEVPVLVPQGKRRLALKLRTIGSEPLAAELAYQLAIDSWVSLRLASAPHYYRYLLQEHGLKSPPSDVGDEPHTARAVIDLRPYNFVRPLKKGESPDADDTMLNVRSVRVEVWRYTFDEQGMALNARKFVEASADAVE